MLTCATACLPLLCTADEAHAVEAMDLDELVDHIKQERATGTVRTNAMRCVDRLLRMWWGEAWLPDQYGVHGRR